MRLLLLFPLLYSSFMLSMNQPVPSTKKTEYPNAKVRLIPTGINQNDTQLIKQYPFITYDIAIQSTKFKNLAINLPEKLNQAIINFEIPNSNKEILNNLATCLMTHNKVITQHVNALKCEKDAVSRHINAMTYSEVANITNALDFLNIQQQETTDTPLAIAIKKLSEIALKYPVFIKENLSVDLQKQIAFYLIASKQYDSKLLEKYSAQRDETIYPGLTQLVERSHPA